MPRKAQLLNKFLWSRVPQDCWCSSQVLLDSCSTCLCNFSCMILIPTTSTHSLSLGRAPLKLFELLCTHRCPGHAWVDLRQWLTGAPWWGHSEYSLSSSSLWDQAEHSPWKTVHVLSFLFGFFPFLVMPPSLPWKLLLVNHLHTHPHPKICVWETWCKTKENKYSFLLCKQLAPGEHFNCLNRDKW